MSEITPIRPGEEFDTSKLQDFLRSQGLSNSRGIEVSQFPGGSSNLTYCVKIGDDEYVLRRPPFGNQVKSAHDMSREFNVLSKLSKVYAPAPKPFFYCSDENVIGSEFYLMERRKGLIIRGDLPESRIAQNGETLENSQRMRQKVAESFIKNLALLHSFEVRSIGLDDLGKPDGYAVRQVEGWTKRYFNAKTDEHPELERSINWLNDNIPGSGGAALLHNDYKFDNVMLDPSDLSKIIAVLDWEMATVGDPLMDLGTTLGYWMSREAGETMLSMPFNPKILMLNISRREIADLYAQVSGADISNILFYYVFGTFKIAVIAQQIYFRFVRGFTRDKRFSNFNTFVSALGKIALNALERDRI